MNDRYTKTVLTVIAACLVAMLARDIWPPAVAQLRGTGPASPVYIAGVSSYAFQYAGPMHVVCDNCR